MGHAVGEALPWAVGVALSPMPVVAMVLMLMSARGRVTGAALLAGWLLGIGAAGTLLLLLAGTTESGGGGPPPTWVSILELVLGVVLLALAVRTWRSRPRGDTEPTTPRWMAAVEAFTPLRAAGLAVLLGVVNPKNLAFLVGGAAAVSTAGATVPQQAVAWVVFTAVAGLGVGAPLVVDVALGDRAGPVLDEIRTWMTRHDTAVTAALCLVIGAKVLGQSLSGFSA